LDRTGLLVRIADHVAAIALGRKLQNTEGQESDGRKHYHKGLHLAIKDFQEIRMSASINLELLILTEYTFLNQELKFCFSGDTKTMNSLNQAIVDFDDAFHAIRIVKESEKYQQIDLCTSHRPQYRYKGMPKDAFHVACAGHKTRLDNILRSPGIHQIEKKLLQERLINMTTAQSVYYGQQKNILDSK
jgi:hypothetical protein